MKFEKINKKLLSLETEVNPVNYSKPSISSFSIQILILLGIQILMLIIYKDFNACKVILSALLGALCAASLNYLITKELPYNSFTICIHGIMIGMLLPETYPVIAVFFITLITLFISRCFIFKNVNSWINISAVTVIICWFVGKQFFPDFLITSELLGLKNPSLYLIQNGSFPVYEFDNSVITFFNNTVFKLANVTVPEGFVSLLWDTHSIIPAFRFNILTILASILLFSEDSYISIIPTLFIIVYAVLVKLFAPLFFNGIFNQGDIILAILTSGTLFTAVFMIQIFGTTPETISGKIIFGIFSGICAFLITGCGTSPIGMVYTVILCNIVNIIIRSVEDRKIIYKEAVV